MGLRVPAGGAGSLLLLLPDGWGAGGRRGRWDFSLMTSSVKTATGLLETLMYRGNRYVLPFDFLETSPALSSFPV